MRHQTNNVQPLKCALANQRYCCSLVLVTKQGPLQLAAQLPCGSTSDLP